MESVETIVSHLATMAEGEGGRMSASTTALAGLGRGDGRGDGRGVGRGDGRGAVPERPGVGDRWVREVGGGWEEYRHRSDRFLTHLT